MSDSLILRHYAHLQQEGTQGFASPSPQTPFFFNAGAGCVRCLQEELLAERALRQAAETALAEERQARETAEKVSEQMYAQSAEVSEGSRRVLVNGNLIITELTNQLLAARAALAACEARLAEAEQQCSRCKGSRVWRPVTFEGDVLIYPAPKQPCPNPIHPAPPPVEETPNTLVCTRKHCPLCTPPATPAPVDRIAPEDRADGPACG